MATSVGISPTEEGSGTSSLVHGDTFDPEWLWRRGRFTCYHREAYKFPPQHQDTLRCGEKNAKSIEGYYLAAERLLPIDEVPELVDCIRSGGHCIGLADPVSNIIINAVRRLPKRLRFDPEHPLPRPPWWQDIAYGSLYGLLGFMAQYFRYLTEVQARRYLHSAHYDLSLAIKLVQHERFSPRTQRPLLPDGGKINPALRVAALRAGHPDPDDLVRIMTAQYPGDLLSRTVTKLRSRERLTVDDIGAIIDLLASQWPPSPMANLEFLCRPEDRTCGADMSDSVLLQVSTCIGQDLVADISIRRHVPLEYISSLTYDDYTFMEIKLSNCLMEVTRQPSGYPADSVVNYDDPVCEHIQSLRMCLLDGIHALYIKALAILPYAAGNSSFLRALLVAGHCYGLMDPVSNIILSYVWYDINFPLEESCAMDSGKKFHAINGIDGILDTGIMSHVEYRSLAGLAFMFHTIYQATSSVHKALEYLYFWNCDLTRIIGTAPRPFAGMAKAAKHPRYTAFESFLSSLSSEKLTHLRSMLQAEPGERISHGHWIELRAFLHNEKPHVFIQLDPVRPLSQEARKHISSKKSAFMSKMTFIRRELRRVLHKYCSQHPWEPSYELDIICGVHVESRSSYPPRFYHANFLAIKVDAGVTSLHERTLFFAEFWELPWYAEQSSFSSRCCHDHGAGVPSSSSFSSSCCPLYDYHAWFGRCIECEGALSKIVHPPSGSHSGNKTVGSIELCESLYQSATDALDTSVFEDDMLDSDFIYSDHLADVKLETSLNYHT